MKHIVIIGANGYVGAKLTRELHEQYRITGIVRSSFPIVKHYDNVHYIHASEPLPFLADAIINTSFSSQQHPTRIHDENKRMAEYINRHASLQTQVIHLSSLSVFGYHLEHAQRPELLPKRWDAPYIESKLHMEHQLNETLGNKPLLILRLGNVWGEGSMWAKSIADSVLLGKPTHYEHAYSNTVSLKEIVAYTQFILSQQPQSGIHHLCDFGQTPWIEWLNLVSSAFQIQLVKGEPFTVPDSWVQELYEKHFSSPMNVLRAIKSSRFIGSRAEELLDQPMMKRLQKVLVKPNHSLPQTERIDFGLQAALSCKTVFQEFINPMYQRPFTKMDVVHEIQQWLKYAGYPVVHLPS